LKRERRNSAWHKQEDDAVEWKRRFESTLGDDKNIFQSSTFPEQNVIKSKELLNSFPPNSLFAGLVFLTAARFGILLSSLFASSTFEDDDDDDVVN